MQKGGEVALLAQTEAGYQNLSVLLSNTFLLSAEAGDSAHCVLDDIGDLGREIIVLGGGLWQGSLGDRRLTDAMGWRQSGLKSWPQGFPGRFYIELQRHGLRPELIAEPHLLEIADRLDLALRRDE